MDAKQAVAAAKAHILELFADERPTQIGLEEIKFDDALNCWLVTIGFVRPWEETPNYIAKMLGETRTYKVVTISDHDGRALAVTNRELASVA